MRSAFLSAVLVLVLRAVAAADCPPDCVGGGGPAATDCILQWGGISSTQASCVDGTACDQDGLADGVCTFPLMPCLGVDASCGVTAISSVRVAPASLSGSATLQAAISALTPGQCTEFAFTLPVKRKAAPAPLKTGKARLKTLTVADGRKDPDALTLGCEPAKPSFAADVQPLIARSCAVAGLCHLAQDTSLTFLDLETNPYAAVVGKPSHEGGKLLLVAPGSIPKSFLARKIIPGVRLKPVQGAHMPQGCPGAPIAGQCLTDQEIYTILSWIQSGAPNN